MSERESSLARRMRASQADAINLHGAVRDVLVERAWFESTGDDMFVLWGGDLNPQNVTFRDCTAVNPGVLRPGWCNLTEI